MVTFSEELTVRNGEAGAPDRLIQRHRSRRQGALLLARCAHCGRPAATALMLLMPEPVNAWSRPEAGVRASQLSNIQFCKESAQTCPRSQLAIKNWM